MIIPSTLRRIHELDVAAVRAVDGQRRGWLTAVMVVITYSGSGFVWAFVATSLTVLCALERELIPGQITFLAGMMGSGCSLILGHTLKAIARRDRPYEAIEGHTALIHPPRDRSLPSTHTSTAIALTVALLLAGHPLAWVVAPWALAVACSRFYLGVHFPSDILFGATMGAACGLANLRPVLEEMLNAVPR